MTPGSRILVANAPAEGWKGQHMKIYDLELTRGQAVVYIRDFGLPGQQPGATSHEGVVEGIPIQLNDFGGRHQESGLRGVRGGDSNGVHSDSRPKKTADGFPRTRKNPPRRNCSRRRSVFLAMSPDQGAHTTFPIFAEPIPEFQGTPR